MLLILGAAVFSVQADFQNSLSSYGYHVDTDMNIKAAIKVSVPSGMLIGGTNYNSVQPGNTICKGATVTVTPDVTTNSKWAVSNLDVRTPYPMDEELSDMMGGSSNYNQNIAWLNGGTFDFFTNRPDEASVDSSDLNSLYFVPESMTYEQSFGVPNYNKRGDVNVFCKGTVQVTDRGQNVGSPMDASALSPQPFTAGVTGSHTIAASINGVTCFGAVLKQPTDPAFRIYYYRQNSPSISASSTQATINVNVQPASTSGACIMTHTSDYQYLRFTQCVHTTQGPKCSEHIMIDMTVTNTGKQAIVLTGVSSSNSGYVASPATTDSMLCAVFGIPDYLCPSTNGFYDSDTNSPIIYVGGTQDVWVNLAIQPGASGPTNVVLTAQTVGNVCGAPLSCNDSLPLGSSNGIFDCAIDPTALSLGVHEIGNFKVTCRQLDGTTLPCTSSFPLLTDGWHWTNGLNGLFYVADNTHASGFSTSGPGASGWVQFNIGSIACHSDVSIHPGPATNYSCAMAPSPATMYKTQSQYFTLSALHHGSPATPDNYDYIVASPLKGTTSNSSVQGTTFTAANVQSAGKLWGFAIFNDPNPYLGGAGCSADINVTGAPPTPQHCAIIPSNLSMEVNLAYAFNVKCTDVLNNPVPCVNGVWGMNGLHGGLLDSNDSYTLAYTDSAPGLTGHLTYSSGNATCLSDLSVSSTAPPYVCDLKPDSSTLVPGQSQPFTFNCSYNGNPTPPDTAQYVVGPPALGSTSGSSVSGTTFTAGNNPGNGDLTGIGFLEINLPPYAVGAVDVSPITVTSSPPPTNCTIDPDVYAMGTQEAVDFHVACTANGPAVPCVGSDWSWLNLNGDFMFKDNVHAIAFSTSSDQSKGYLQYTSGTAVCRSNITINNTGPGHTANYTCTFDPDAANVLEGGSVYFNLNCAVNGVPAVPDDASYALNPTTLGSNSNESVHGATFDAGDTVVSGHQYGLGEITIAPYPTLGGVAIANLKVVNESNQTCVGSNCSCVGPNCQCTGPGCGNKPHGHTDFCTIRGGTLNANLGVDVYPGGTVPLSVMCGPNEDLNCPDILWNPGTGYYVASQSSSGALVVITTNSLGQIVTVTITEPGGPSTSTCSIDLYLTAPQCLQVS